MNEAKEAAHVLALIDWENRTYPGLSEDARDRMHSIAMIYCSPARPTVEALYALCEREMSAAAAVSHSNRARITRSVFEQCVNALPKAYVKLSRRRIGDWHRVHIPARPPSQVPRCGIRRESGTIPPVRF